MKKKRDSWASGEFENVDLKDKRLNNRLMKICDSFSESPESSINQACADWTESKAAYRFFQNENVKADEIVAAHRQKTVERCQRHKIILAIQDTSYFIYTNHPETEGLGKISYTKGVNVEKNYTKGLIMHTCLSVTTEGLPLGLLDQNIFPRKPRENDYSTLPVKEKESYRWLESLKRTKEAMGDNEVITVCDREADLYDFFNLANQLETYVLVRAQANRIINKKSTYEEKNVTKLWEHLTAQPAAGSFTIKIQERRKSKHCKKRSSRNATVTVKYGAFTLNAPRKHPEQKTKQLPDIKMQAIYVFEPNPPEGAEAIEWMLLTNHPVRSFAEAREKISWYALRWRIEMYFKILKSGFSVEKCRLAYADRLIKYLTIMSIVSWRLFMITLIARTEPDIPCTNILADQEWKILFLKVNKNKKLPRNPPSISKAVIWIARLGGFLARKSDGAPGTITLWRGWKRLIDLTEGYNLVAQIHTYG